MADILKPSNDHVMGIGPPKGRYAPTGFEMGAEEIPLEGQWWLGNPMGDVPIKTISCSNCGKNIEIPLKAAMQFSSMLCRDCNPDFQNSKCGKANVC